MRFFLALLALSVALKGQSVPAADGPVDDEFLLRGRGGSVVVVYNSDMPGSREVALHYAAMRRVPEDQILGLSMSKEELFSRANYINQLEKPLRHFLEEKRLLVLEPNPNSTNTGALRVKEARIRYIVLCYGVPLRISGEGGLNEPDVEKIPAEFRKNGAAVESELALLPWPDSHYRLAAYIVNPLYGTTNAAAINPTNGVLIVSRLDGSTVDIARRLVDKAMAAESYGLWGRAYFDLRDITNGSYKMGDDWIRTAARAASIYGFETFVDDKPETFSAGFPMCQIALYAGWYDGDVSGPFTRPNVEFMPGAFAYHLHSFSAQTLRSTNTHWCGPLLAEGVTATMGCVDEPYLAGTPNIGFFMTRWLDGFTFGEAALAAQGPLSWQTAVIGDPLYRPFGRNPQKLHDSLIARDSPLIEWSHLRVVDLSIVHGVAVDKLIQYLQETEVTRRSAVLTQKLGDLYDKARMPDLAIDAWQRALKLNPSPQQSIQLTLLLGDKLAADLREEQALDLYDAFFKQHPHYPDALPVYEKMEVLAKKLHRKSQAKRYAEEIARLNGSPAK